MIALITIQHFPQTRLAYEGTFVPDRVLYDQKFLAEMLTKDFFIDPLLYRQGQTDICYVYFVAILTQKSSIGSQTF